MSLHVLSVILACVCISHCWNPDITSRGFPSIQEQQLRSGEAKRPQCFGLARRTRHLKINAPVIFNRRTGQASPFPRTLLHADDSVVARIENDGWEVRKNIISIPQQTYERVPVCCPWDQNCDQGRPDTTAQSFDAPGSCANGGQLIYRDGLQRCECQPGFQGAWCQTLDSTEGNQATPTFPSGPLIRPMSPPSPYSDMIKEAELWRSKTMQMPMPSMLSPKEHLLAAVARPWAVRAAMMQQQNMRAKMAQDEQMYRHTQADFYNQSPPQGTFPYDVRRNVNVWGGNPYGGAVDSSRSFSAGHEADHNPYNSLPYQGHLPPSMLRAFSVVKENLREAQTGNPYSHMSQETPNPHILALIQRVKVEQGEPSPYNRQPQVDLNLFNRRPQNDLNPYRRRPQDMPQARTPWDLDPFGQQQNPSYMNYPGMPMGPNRNRQAMALALYQQMMNQRRSRLSEGRKSLNRPLLGATVRNPVASSPASRASQPSPLVTEISLVANNQSEQEVNTSDSNSTQTQTDEQQSPISRQTEMPLGMTEQQQQQQASSEEVNRIQQQQPSSEEVNRIQQQQPSSEEVNRIQQQQPSSEEVNRIQQQQPSSEEVNRIQQQQPSSEEVNRIQQCRTVLMPKLSACLQGYDLTMEQFMNPEHMAKARAVCDASQSVGQCLMQHDKVCGDSDAVLTTRRLINSVLRMMGMVCQQIAARGDNPIMPMQGPQDSPQLPLREVPSPITGPMIPNQRESFNNPLTPLNEEEQVPPMSDNGTDEFEQTLAPKTSHTTSAQDGERASEIPVSKGSMGYESAFPVSLELKVFGYPLWLIVTLGLALFVAFILFLVILCMCCRRRCRQKSRKANKEIEKIPVSLDSKPCTLDMPPPSYRTAIVLQNEDGLSLPPLDLSDESGNTSLKSNDEKPPMDEDSDDGSDAKEEPEKRK